jgi:glucose-6-phosphate isomerase/transaldolase/glucose-6-phosphate isomerase
VSSFGLWVEQLLAESLGKDGRGLVPVIDEPSLETAGYGADRTFVYLRLSGDDNTASDKFVRGLEVVGKSVLTIEVIDCYDLGAEFYRWEFATAVSGALIGVHPFNQPDVQGTKIATSKILDEYAASGRLPAVTDSTSLADLLSRIARGKYLAIMAYLAPTPAVAAALTDLRREIARRYGIATTLGYGPRYLHSTGQLHKGGLASGLFLQLTADHETDFEIPGMSVTFGVLADAEALGDLQALQNRGRSVARVNLGTDAAAAIRQLLVV